MNCPQCNNQVVDPPQDTDTITFGQPGEAIHAQIAYKRWLYKCSCGFSWTDHQTEESQHNAVMAHLRKFPLKVGTKIYETERGVCQVCVIVSAQTDTYGNFVYDVKTKMPNEEWRTGVRFNIDPQYVYENRRKNEPRRGSSQQVAE